MPGCGSGAVVLPWSSPRLQHHAAVAQKNHLSRLFRFPQPPLIDDPAILAEATAAQEARYQADAWDARIDRWLTHDTRSVNRGHAGWDDWQDEEFERPEPIRDVSVGEILEGALGIEPAKWTKGDQMRVGAWLKSRDWERYRSGAAPTREWRYRRLQHG